MNKSKQQLTFCAYRPGTNSHTVALIKSMGAHQRPMASIFHQIKDAALSDKEDFSAFIQNAEQHFNCDLSKVSIIIPASLTYPSEKPTDEELDLNEVIYCSENKLSGIPCSFLAPKQWLAEQVRAFNNVGLQVREFLDERFLLGEALPLFLATAKNAVFADITERKTSLHVNTAGDWFGSTDLALGSGHFVQDLRAGLNVDQLAARNICFELGLSADSFIGHDPLGQGQNWRDVVSILAPRAKELASLMARALIRYKGQLDSGIYLAGVGATIPGLAEFMADLLRIKIETVGTLMRANQDLIDVEIHANGLKAREPSSYFCHVIHASVFLAQRMRQDKDAPAGFLRSSLRELSTWLKELS